MAVKSKSLIFFTVIALSLSLISGCGRKGQPERPPLNQTSTKSAEQSAEQSKEPTLSSEQSKQDFFLDPLVE